MPQAPPPTLHTLLTYSASGRVRCDVSRDVTEIRLHQNTSVHALNEPAVQPPTSRMIINTNILDCPRWTIEVMNPYGVTVRDVLAKICEAMKYPINNTEFNAFSASKRTSASTLYAQRSQGDQNTLSQGLYRCDFMGQHKFFVGLQASPGSYSWDIYFDTLC